MILKLVKVTEISSFLKIINSICTFERTIERVSASKEKQIPFFGIGKSLTIKNYFKYNVFYVKGVTLCKKKAFCHRFYRFGKIFTDFF
jgi:hypothetical protein